MRLARTSSTVTHSDSLSGLARPARRSRSTPAPEPGRLAAPARRARQAPRGSVCPAGRDGCARPGSRRRAVAGDVGARCVDHVRQVHGREELLDELLAELALHERVRRDLPDEPRRPSEPAVRTASWNSRSAKGTDSAYLPEHDLSTGTSAVSVYPFRLRCASCVAAPPRSRAPSASLRESAARPPVTCEPLRPLRAALARRPGACPDWLRSAPEPPAGRWPPVKIVE